MAKANQGRKRTGTAADSAGVMVGQNKRPKLATETKGKPDKTVTRKQCPRGQNLSFLKVIRDGLRLASDVCTMTKSLQKKCKQSILMGYVH